MKTKTTKEILESGFANEYFDIQQDLQTSEIPKEENIDYQRLNTWCANYNDIWIKLSDLKDLIVLIQNKPLKDLYDNLCSIKTLKMVKRKCKYCNETTNKALSDFHEIGWEAVSFNGRKAVCACPIHCKQLEKDMNNALVRSTVEVAC